MADNYNKANDSQAVSIWDLEQTNTDITVSPHVMVRGIMGKTAAGAWEYLSAAGNRMMVSGTFTAATSPLSADSSSVSAIQEGANRLRVSTFSGDAGTMRVSAVGGTNSPLSADSSSVSAIQEGANRLRMSAIQGDGANLNVSAKSQDAGTLLISAKQGDGALLRVSALLPSGNWTNTDASNLDISAKSNDAGTFLVSAKSDSAGQLRVSADLIGHTTGNLTIYRTLNASASQAVKATAGAIYGWYLYNHDDLNQYIKFYNTSGAINVGTDTPVMTVMLPPSAAANMEFPHGLKGFTNGIGIAAISGAADDNTTASPASAVGANIFYV